MNKKYRNFPLGKFKSKLEYRVYKSIFYHLTRKQKNNNIKVDINKRGLLKNNKLFEIDIYFSDLQLGIEIQGPTHYIDIEQINRDLKKKNV